MPHPAAGMLTDAGNPLLDRAAVRLETGSLETPDGTLGIITIRTPTTTLTVFLPAEDIRSWTGVLAELGDQVNGTSLIRPAPQDVSLLASLARKGRQR